MADLQISSAVTVAVVYRNPDGSARPASDITGTVANSNPSDIVTVSMSSDNTQLTITPVSGVTGRTVVQVDASAGTESLDTGILGVHVLGASDPRNSGVQLIP
jgi:hypothetical protein